MVAGESIDLGFPTLNSKNDQERRDPANTTCRMSIFLIKEVNAPRANNTRTISHGTAFPNFKVA